MKGVGEHRDKIGRETRSCEEYSGATTNWGTPEKRRNLNQIFL